jgi:hypothetical protein
VVVTTTLGEMDEFDLLTRMDSWENDDQRVTAIEYCLRECVGEAHRTGAPAGSGCFCPMHVHRSVSVTMKRWPEGGIDGFTASF